MVSIYRICFDFDYSVFYPIKKEEIMNKFGQRGRGKFWAIDNGFPRWKPPKPLPTFFFYLT